MNLEATIEYFAPVYAAKRALARERIKAFRNNAAYASPDRQNSPLSQNPESNTQKWERWQLIQVARDMEENFPFMSYAAAKVSREVVGTLGYQAATGDKQTDEEIERRLRERFKRIDITERMSLQDYAKLALYRAEIDGDTLTIFTRENPETPAENPIRLQMVHADSIGQPWGSGMQTAEKQGGVVINGCGKPVGYEIWQWTVLNSYTYLATVPACQAVLLARLHYANQYRGTPWFKAALDTMKDYRETVDNLRSAIKWASTVNGMVTTESGDPGLSVLQRSTTSAGGNPGPIYYDARPGIWTGKPGEQITEFKSERPSTNTLEFLDRLMREMCLSIRRPFEWMVSLQDTGGVSARLIKDVVDLANKEDRQWLESTLLNRVAQVLIQDEIAYHRLPVPAGCDPYRGRWTYGPKPTADIGRESAANLAENAAGALPLASIYDDRGEEDVGSGLEQTAKESRMVYDLAKKYQVPPSSIKAGIPDIHPAGIVTPAINSR